MLHRVAAAVGRGAGSQSYLVRTNTMPPRVTPPHSESCAARCCAWERPWTPWWKIGRNCDFRDIEALRRLSLLGLAQHAMASRMLRVGESIERVRRQREQFRSEEVSMVAAAFGCIASRGALTVRSRCRSVAVSYWPSEPPFSMSIVFDDTSNSLESQMLQVLVRGSGRGAIETALHHRTLFFFFFKI